VHPCVYVQHPPEGIGVCVCVCARACVDVSADDSCQFSIAAQVLANVAAVMGTP
jgi:hypothetical protein